MPDEEKVRTIDITPSWSALVPVFVGVLQNPNAPAEAHRQIVAEVTKMAQLADLYVKAVKENGGTGQGLQPVLTDPDTPAGRA